MPKEPLPKSGRWELGDFFTHLWPAMGAGIRRRCPVCHKGRLYAGPGRLNERCPACGIRFEPDPGDFAGALMLTMGVTGLFVALGTIVLEVAFHLSGDTQLWIWVTFACLFLPLAYPNFKGAWLGFMYTLRRMK